MGVESENNIYAQFLDGAGQNKIESVCIWGGSIPGFTHYLQRERERLYTTEREEIIATPGILLLVLAPAALAKPTKLHPVENYIQLAGIASPIIATGIAVLIPCLECN
jgi:hypothetical protein